VIFEHSENHKNKAKHKLATINSKKQQKLTRI